MVCSRLSSHTHTLSLLLAHGSGQQHGSGKLLPPRRRPSGRDDRATRTPSQRPPRSPSSGPLTGKKIVGAMTPTTSWRSKRWDRDPLPLYSSSVPLPPSSFIIYPSPSILHRALLFLLPLSSVVLPPSPFIVHHSSLLPPSSFVLPPPSSLLPPRSLVSESGPPCVLHCAWRAVSPQYCSVWAMCVRVSK